MGFKKRLSKMDKFIGFVFPKGLIKCKPCNLLYKENRGVIRFANRNYNGPFCEVCGHKLTRIKKTTEGMTLNE